MDQTTTHALIERHRLELVEEALSRRAAVAPLPVGVPAETRTLPFPFRSFITVTSDCDGPNLQRWRHVGETVREKFALPIADSLFILWAVKRGYPRNDPETFSADRFLDSNAFLLRRFHRGWFDVIHGWFECMTLCTAEGFELVAGEGEPPRHRVRFDTPADWRQVPAARRTTPPRHLCLRYALPLANSAFRMTGFAGDEELFTIDSESFDPQHRLVPLPVMIDLGELMDPDPRLLELEIEFELTTTGEGHRLVVEEPMLVSATRAQVEHHIEVMRQFNMRLSAFTTHGIATAFAARFGYDVLSADPRWLADRRENPHYFRDLFELAGVEFLNTQHNITGNDMVQLVDLLKPNVLNDGQVKYDFNRYLHIPLDAEGMPDLTVFQHEEKPTNMSAGDYLGVHLRGALGRLDGSGTGALVYTHAGFRCGVLLAAEEERTGEKADRFDALNEDAQAALAELADRYYDLSGGVEERDRVFVAPTAVLLRLAQVQRHVREHARYDARANAIHVTTWFDPVTRLPVPNPRIGPSQLRWASFYVDDAVTARLFVDGEPVTHLIRFPADESGRQSIAIADVNAPTVIFDEVPPAEKGEVELAGATLALTDEDAFRGGHALRLEATGEPGAIRFRPAVPVDVRNHQCLRLAYRQLGDDASLAVRLHLSGGVTWSVSDGSLAGIANAALMPRYRDREWHDTIVPYWRLVGAHPVGSRGLPPAAVEMVEIVVAGAVLLDCLELLRDNEMPASDGGCLIGGKVEPAAGLSTVVMTVDGESSEARVTAGGHYVFERRAPRGSVIELHGVTADGRRAEPLGGARREIMRDSLDHDFRLVRRPAGA